MRRLVSVLGVSVVSVGMALGGATGASAASGPTASGVIESSGGDTVSAQPPVSRPDTRHCTVTLADHFKSNAADLSPQLYSGSVQVPDECKGKWSKVVLDSTTSVSGRQYDRSGELEIGGVPVWFGTTQEPNGAKPTTFSFSKDITEFSSLFKTPQKFSGGYTNYMSDVYTGNYDQTVKITFYLADRKHPAPDVPDKVVGVPVADLTPGSATASTTLSDLPRNIIRAQLETTLKGNGCDEQWFTAVPDAVAAKFPGAGLCAAGAYREAAVSVDGTPAGDVGTFPHIYSGGIVPTLWRPVVAIDTLDMRTESLDLTPFAGRLVDGKTHSISFGINPIGDTWNVRAALFLWTDHHRAQTSGALTEDSVAASPATSTTAGDPVDGTVKYAETARRSDMLSGYVDTLAGRVVTTVNTSRNWSNSGSVGDSGMVQSITQQDAMTTQSVSRIGHRVVRSASLNESYPISVDFSAADYVNDQNFSLNGTVDMTQQVSSSVRTGSQLVRRGWDWNVTSYGVLARKDGTTSESDGHSTTSYAGTDDNGRPYWHRITTDHGQVVTDRQH
ncbi:peptide-N4-asparagine amidase [Flexivirga alba]|uniref:Peptide-N4-asparagine amidase n=1 Tax=Flexivirga alba TaxID=702742 RepID=A0ABW2AE04_9MICO